MGKSGPEFRSVEKKRDYISPPEWCNRFECRMRNEGTWKCPYEYSNERVDQVSFFLQLYSQVKAYPCNFAFIFGG